MPDEGCEIDRCDSVQQFWADESQPYQFVSVTSFSDAFKETKLGKGWQEALGKPFQRPEGFIDDLDPLQRTRWASALLQPLLVEHALCPFVAS